MEKPTCTVDGCGSAKTRRDWCWKHYQRWIKHGDPAYQETKYQSCQVEGCDKYPRSARSGLCEMHYARRRRHGSPLIKIDMRRPDAKYRSIHARIVKDRGHARDHPCIDCGTQAGHWSYNHMDPDALVSDQGLDYSLSSSFYEPRCFSCHAIFDGVGRNQYSLD